MTDYSLTASEKLACLKGFDLAVEFFKIHAEAQEIHNTVSAGTFKEVLSQCKLIREKLVAELNK
jgi:hypothetical protein